ncbi:MAG: hypothetical protein ACOY5B_14050 [Spirochaetota bacterium]
MSHELQQLRERVEQLAAELAELRQTRRERFVAWVRRSRRTLTALVLCFVVVPVAVSAFTTPNTFTAGSPAVASQINDNFAAIKTRFDDMENKSWRLISEADVGASTNQVDITGLNGDSDFEYQIRIKIISGANGGYYTLQPNGDSAGGNFALKGWSGNAHNDNVVISTTALAVPGIYVGFTNAISQQALSETSVFSKGGNSRVFLTQRANAISAASVTDSIGTTYTVWNNSASNITSFRLVSQNINGIGAGTHIEIWARR